MRRPPIGLFLIGGFALFALGALATGGGGALGALVWFPFKVLLFIALFGFIGKMLWRVGGGWGHHGHYSDRDDWGYRRDDDFGYRRVPDAGYRRGFGPPGGRPWHEHRRQREQPSRPTDHDAEAKREQFDEWHSHAHARMEIDEMFPDPKIDDTGGPPPAAS